MLGVSITRHGCLVFALYPFNGLWHALCSVPCWRLPFWLDSWGSRPPLVIGQWSVVNRFLMGSIQGARMFGIAGNGSKSSEIIPDSRFQMEVFVVPSPPHPPHHRLQMDEFVVQSTPSSSPPAPEENKAMILITNSASSGKPGLPRRGWQLTDVRTPLQITASWLRRSMEWVQGRFDCELGSLRTVGSAMRVHNSAKCPPIYSCCKL